MVIERQIFFLYSQKNKKNKKVTKNQFIKNINVLYYVLSSKLNLVTV